MENKSFKPRRRFLLMLLSLTLAIAYSIAAAISVYAEGEAEVALKVQSEIGGGEIMDFEGEAGGLYFPVNGVMWESDTQMMVNNIAGPFNESERESIKADFVEFAGSLGGNITIGNTNSFQGYKVIEYLEVTDGQESMIGWLIEYEKHLVYNVVAVPPGTAPTENLRSKIENLSEVSLRAMAEQGYVPSEKSGEEGDLNLEEIAGEESDTEEEAPEQESQGGIVPGTTTTGSKYEPNSSGDVFEGGVWNSSKGESDYLERRFDSPTLISEIRIARAGTDVTTENSSLTMKLQTPDGNWITVDSLQDTNINITSLTGGATANSIPSYRKVLDEPVEAIAFRLEMTGHGWFSAEAIELLSGSAGPAVPAPGGIGSVGNIPGPESTTEAVAGVVIPGVLVTVLGNIVGMAGTGGFSPGGTSEMFVDGIEEEFGVAASDEIYYSEDNSEEVFLGEMREKSLEGERAGSEEELENEAYDENGFDSDGYNSQGYDRDGYDREGYDVHGYNRNGVDREGFNSDGYDREGYDREGYDQKGYDREGYDSDGYNQEGYDRDGYNVDGYDSDGYSREGYDREGYDREGYDRDGYDPEGYDRGGYDSDGYNIDGYDRDGYDRDGYDSEGYNSDGYDRDGYDSEGYSSGGYDRDGYDRDGYNREGLDRDGVRKGGYDEEGYDREGYDYEGYDRDGYDRDGYDRDGYDSDGYDVDGYSSEGYDRYGYDSNGYDRDGYDADGYNPEGYDRDGYSVDGYDREGYDRDGYDSEGYDRDGFDSEGYGRDGYDADGYSRSNHDRYGVHRDYKKKPEQPKPESGPPSEPGGPLPGRWEYQSAGIKIESIEINRNPGPIDPSKVKNPFQEEFEWVWVPGEKPKSGEAPEAPETDSGVIGPEDPMNTLKNHDLGQKDSGTPGGDIPEAETQEPGEWESPIVSTEDGDYDPRDGYLRFPPEEGSSPSPASEAGELDYGVPTPSEPEELTMVDSLGREHIYVKDPETGEYINILTGGQLDRDRWDEWNSNLRNEREWIDEQMRKLQSGDNAQDRAIEDLLENQRLQENLLKIRKDISESKDGTGMLNRGKDEPGDVITKIDKILDEAAEKGEMDLEDYEKVRRIYQKARKKEIIPESEAYKPSDWEIIDDLAHTYEKTVKEVVTGSDDEGNISVLGIAGRILIGVATAGGSEMIFTPADILITTKRLVDQGKSNAEIAKEFVKDYIMGKAIGKIGELGSSLISKGTKKLAQYAARKLPKTASKLQKAAQWAGKELSKERHLIAPKTKVPAKKPKLPRVARSPESRRPIKNKAEYIESQKVATEKSRLKYIENQKANRAKGKLEIDKDSFKVRKSKPSLENLSAKEQRAIKFVAEENNAKLIMRQKSKKASDMIAKGEAYPKIEKLKLKSVKQKDLKKYGYSQDDVDKVMLKKPLPPKRPKLEGRTPEQAKKLKDAYKKRYKEYKNNMMDYKDNKMDLEDLMAKDPNIKWNPDTGEITYKGKPFVGDNDAFTYVDATTGDPLSPKVTAKINRELNQHGVTVHNEHAGWDYSGLKESDKVYPSGKTAYEKAKAIDKRILEKSHAPGVKDSDALVSYDPINGWGLQDYVGGGRDI